MNDIAQIIFASACCGLSIIWATVMLVNLVRASNKNR